MTNNKGINSDAAGLGSYLKPCWSFILQASSGILNECKNVEPKGLALILTSALVSKWCGYGYVNYASGFTAGSVFFYSNVKKLHDDLDESRNHQREIAEDYDAKSYCS